MTKLKSKTLGSSLQRYYGGLCYIKSKFLNNVIQVKHTNINIYL